MPIDGEDTGALRSATPARRATDDDGGGEAPVDAQDPVEAPATDRARAKRQRKTATAPAGSQGDAG